MPESFSTIINHVLARVRDPGALQHSHALCLDLLTRLQHLYNNQLRLVLTDLTLPTLPMLQLYSFQDALQGQGITIRKVTHENLPLERMTLTQLRHLDPLWPRATGGRFHGFMQLGYSFLLLWPALLDASTITITATTLTSDLTSLPGDGTLDIPSQHTPRLAQLLELLLLLRQRDMITFDGLLQQLSPRKLPNGT